MRHAYSVAFVTALLSACATTKPVAVEQKKPVEAKPVEAPFAISEVTTPNQTLLGAALRIEGKVLKVSERDLAWTAKIGERIVGQGNATIEPGADGTFTADADIKLGESLDDLKQYQSADTIEVLIDAKLGAHTAEHAISIRTPQLPKVVVQTVQAQKIGPANIGVGFFVSIKNPNLFDVKMSSFSFKASINGKVFATETQPGGSLQGAAGTEFQIQSIEANAENCGKDINKFIKLSTLTWGLAGDIQFDTATMPYALTGTMKLSN